MGGAKFMQAFFQAYLRGRVAPQIVAALADLRAVIFYKDEKKQKMRPIGIGESLRRLICRVIAQQDREAWAKFFTHMLPEDAEAYASAKAEAEEALEVATHAHVAAQTAGAPGLEASAATRMATAQAALAVATQPVNFPVNHCFSPSGPERTR